MQIPEAGATAAADTRPTGRRERKRRQVRDQLYAAALDLFVTQGYETTTMEQIAEAADVARATVFNHFSQKVGFLEEWGARRRARVAEILGSSQLEDLSTGDQLRRYLREMAELNIASRPETTVLMDAGARVGSLLHDRSLEIELAKIAERGRQRGELRTGVDADQVGAMLAASYFSTVLRWIRVEPAPFDLRDRLDGALDVILLGILDREGEGVPSGR
ncbi:TetR/AcrR family transcriptional regulator [Streptomyces sp. NBC_00554]|uniref:TetR/AcrR family transcriptional regulator n=1 Tax=unclassified Streptomyces TaxID=2593676 RepID=UPI00224FAD10|nr:TetR/AcrR family transcriptional regulator [Streptomyces sp. NBC_00620]MCX4972814.1 TetR/AcrR family transcriptional regulator [Streptomyces sp. NBC_00620]WUC50759.1 TetR/AcrR family transcriptional regulator [Streptomyces sp. NBC_00554]